MDLFGRLGDQWKPSTSEARKARNASAKTAHWVADIVPTVSVPACQTKTPHKKMWCPLISLTSLTFKLAIVLSLADLRKMHFSMSLNMISWTIDPYWKDIPRLDQGKQCSPDGTDGACCDVDGSFRCLDENSQRNQRQLLDRSGDCQTGSFKGYCMRGLCLLAFKNWNKSVVPSLERRF